MMSTGDAKEMDGCEHVGRAEGGGGRAETDGLSAEDDPHLSPFIHVSARLTMPSLLLFVPSVLPLPFPFSPS